MTGANARDVKFWLDKQIKQLRLVFNFSFSISLS